MPTSLTGTLTGQRKPTRTFVPRSAFPKPGSGVMSVPQANAASIRRKSAAQASTGYQISPGTMMGRLKDNALKTFGFKSVLWLRQQVELDRTMMEFNRSTFIQTWWELSRFFSPRRTRFLESDVNNGWRRNSQIIDDTGGQAKDVLAAGMLAGISSPTRQWFTLATNTKADESQPVRDWCYDESQNMATVFARSNLYEELPLLYEDAGTFATGLIWMSESIREVVTFKSLPVGSYSISHDPEGHICRFYRSFMMTVQQLLDEFGIRNARGEIMNWEHFSQAVRNAHDNHMPQTWFYVGHYIRPNDEPEPEAPGTEGMPFLEVYFERGQVNETAAAVSTTNTGSEQWRFLRIRGLEQMPLMELIWKKTGEDDYGTECPGVRSVGDVRQLQVQEKRVSQASEKMINPPMQGPSTLKGQRASIIAGDLTLYDQRNGDPGFRPVHEVNLNIQMMEQRSDRIRNRIRQAWYYDLFLMMEQEDQTHAEPITAAEVREKHQEKLLMLSPVLEKANRGTFTPLIEFTFRAMQKRGMVSTPPAELRGKPLTVQYTSVFAQALKLIELETIKDFSAWIQQQAQVQPGILDMVDYDEMAKLYAEKEDIPPHILRSEETVKALRNQRAKVQQQQAQMQAAAQQAQTAKNLAQAPTDPNNPNALTQLLQGQDAQTAALIGG